MSLSSLHASRVATRESLGMSSLGISSDLPSSHNPSDGTAHIPSPSSPLSSATASSISLARQEPTAPKKFDTRETNLLMSSLARLRQSSCSFSSSPSLSHSSRRFRPREVLRRCLAIFSSEPRCLRASQMLASQMLRSIHQSRFSGLPIGPGRSITFVCTFLHMSLIRPFAMDSISSCAAMMRAALHALWEVRAAAPISPRSTGSSSRNGTQSAFMS
mmetsp:Transcript_43721/g.106123  ORF Transcript_43721/g.106123 Transcript_43721/m.106123 type:complete len:217 (+) Transcript_43721:1994-2644(+)